MSGSGVQLGISNSLRRGHSLVIAVGNPIELTQPVDPVAHAILFLPICSTNNKLFRFARGVKEEPGISGG